MKIAIIIAFKGFKDAEYFVVKNILSDAGADILTVSSQKGVAIGSDGGDTKVEDASEVKTEDFDAIVFIGGEGMGNNLDNKQFQEIAQDSLAKGKILGAICISPALLARAGVLKGKRATVWSAPLNKEAINILKENEAIYEDKDVVVDGKIVTGNGPMAADEFAKTILKLLTEYA